MEDWQCKRMKRFNFMAGITSENLCCLIALAVVTKMSRRPVALAILAATVASYIGGVSARAEGAGFTRIKGAADAGLDFDSGMHCWGETSEILSVVERSKEALMQAECSLNVSAQYGNAGESISLRGGGITGPLLASAFAGIPLSAFVMGSRLRKKLCILVHLFSTFDDALTRS